ncbi:MAG: sensor histidine kinase [Gammaproteobacteria bacterium]|jgi:signal transduction histidine kinase|nr:sensor histidine kinase [Gammaproteobacteria bacterium]MBT3724346.1 sensor histidine kinase [Gammaproteobacteria bacterium]MBT4076101.1 sensor histidine kinase [Gammaproteobacteria bacterium]MBT4193609.1 sensor histidine kinase [Gammaproteobacteria bacterium]MBT4452050.1 sensor histidine kinase [Gammaproteobacteria bacterium]
MPMYSLKKSLNKSLIINMILVMVVMLFTLNIFIQQLVKEQVLTRLQHDAESLVSIIQQDSENNLSINPAQISTVYNRVRSGHYYMINTPQQIIRSRSLFDFEVVIPDSENKKSISYEIKGAGEEIWLVWQQVIHKKNQPLLIWVAEDIAPFQQQLIKFSLIIVLLVIIFGFVLIYLQQRILNKAFHVFDVLRSNLQSVRYEETEKAGTQVPVEISPLVEEIEMLVEQLRLRIQRTRNAIGNLAHEIKRPLQILSLHLDSGEDKQSAILSFKDIQLIVDRELRRAKISGSNVVGGTFHINDELPYLFEVMKKIYPEVHIQENLQGNLNDVNIDRDDMMELTGNLLDNACKFAQSSIQFKINRTHTGLSIVVEDDGPGVDSTLFEKITGKGLRLDETVQGHGLGLSICSDIIDSYKGKLSFSDSKLGGLKVEAFIPLSNK